MVSRNGRLGLAGRLGIAALLAPLVPTAMAGYMSVSITSAVQCGNITVNWQGDDGPWHLLLTPTEIVQHGYNLWVPEIPANATNWTLPINLPSGTDFLVTMWGVSGIAYAGTTDVTTVGPSPTKNSSCFLSDEAILSLYSFSYNISDPTQGFPAQCSNLTMDWPTSLESNVTSARRSLPDASSVDIPSLTERAPGETVEAAVDNDGDGHADKTVNVDVSVLDQSSSDHNGNTTTPPTMFGIIPMGNSFNIPITYARDSKIAQYLPESSLSDRPTTWTSRGVTYMNWTIDLAKGTRFILVAGIGSNQQWASGGSSKMFTVGQGTTDCSGSENNSGQPKPSITGSSTATASASPSPVVSDDSTTSSGPQSSTISPLVRTIIACVLSVLGTLALVILFIVFRRIRRRRALAAHAAPFPADLGSRKSKRPFDGRISPDTQLDLISGGPPVDRRLSRIDTGRAGSEGSGELSPSGSDPFRDTPHEQRGFFPPPPGGGPRINTLSQSSTMTPLSSPLSPTRYRDDLIGAASAGDAGAIRHPSQEALLRQHGYDSPQRTSLTDTYSAGHTTVPTVSTHRPLRLHDRTFGLGFPDDEDYRDGGAVEDDVPELKRDILALGEASGSGSGTAGAGPEGRAMSPVGPPSGNASLPPGVGAGDIAAMAGIGSLNSGRRRRARPDDRELEYMVHRDAGRLAVGTAPPGGERRVLELPPRYEELDWERERELEDGEGDAGDRQNQTA